MGFREDASRLWKDHTAENIAWVRRMSVPLLTRVEARVGISGKRKMAGWDDDFLLHIVARTLA